MRNRTLARRAITAIKQGIAFLYRSDFCVDESAPISTPFSSDIGSDLAIVQVDGNIGISGGAMDIPAQATPVWGDLGFFSVDSFTRENGLVALFNLNFGTLDDASLGFLDAQDALNTSYDNIGVAINGTALEARFTSDANSPDIFTLSSSTDYVIALVLRASGRFIYLLDGLDWLLLWVDETDSTATLFLGYANLSSIVALDTMRVRQLSANLFVPSIEIVGSLNEGDGSVSGGDLPFPDGDVVFKFTLGDIGTGQTRLQFRIEDSNNFWHIQFNSVGSLFTLHETVDGSDVVRATDSGFIDDDEFTIVIRGTSITAYLFSDEIWTYASAIKFFRETDWELENLSVGGDINSFQVWKASARNESGLGPEEVKNGTFDSDVDWTKGTGWTIGSGVANCDGTQGGATNLFQALVCTPGKYYQASYTVLNRSAGSVRFINLTGGSFFGVFRAADDTYTEIFVAKGTSIEIQGNTTFVGDIDNVIVEEILFVPDDLGRNFNQSLLGDCVGAGFSSGFSDGFS